MESIITDDVDKCFLCESPYIEEHHTIYGRANRKLSTKYKLIIPVCRKCHMEIHKNKDLDRQIKALSQQRFEEVYDISFFEVFKKNYKGD